MNVYVPRFAHNPEMERALIPRADARHLMRSGSESKDVPSGLLRELTRVHEAGHAVLATVLRGFACEFMTVEVTAPSAKVIAVHDDIPEGNNDLIDLAGLYAELHLVKGELAYCYAHLKNATHDLDNARSRLASAEAAVTWARKYQPIGEEAVGYFWPAISALAHAVPDTGTLAHQDVERVVQTGKPDGPAPDSLRERLKPEYRVP